MTHDILNTKFAEHAPYLIKRSMVILEEEKEREEKRKLNPPPFDTDHKIRICTMNVLLPNGHIWELSYDFNDPRNPKFSWNWGRSASDLTLNG